MLFDFLDLISHPENYRSAWRDGDLVIEFAPETTLDVSNEDQQSERVQAAVAGHLAQAREPAE
jgi:hypothetical protein